MKLFFVTGNKNKFLEVKQLIPSINQLEIDLEEIQHTDPQTIIAHKLLEALKHKREGIIVEDISLNFQCLGGLPGPLIKWFMKSLELDRLVDLTVKLKNNKARAIATVGLAIDSRQIFYFEGTIKGEIVFPRGEGGFGWDSIFKPDSCSKTFAQMSLAEKNKYSMRKLAFIKLKEFLVSKNLITA